ncbi:MAG: arsenic resistance N-acetyltransferase ArsN2 [Halobaculum sp.]
MTDPDVTLRPAGDDLQTVEQFLDRNDLPTDDLRERSDSFFLARADGETVGVGGVEQHGTDELLRSVVVRSERRGAGYGAVLTERLEARAATEGVERLFLLTTTARSFFDREGYEQTDRAAVPEPIRETTQFADLCPESATVLSKRLD